MKPLLIVSVIAAILVAAGVVFVVVRPAPTGFSVESQKKKILTAREELLASERYFDLRDKNEILISVVGFFFQPQKIVVKPGTRVFWKNEDDAGYLIESEDLLSLASPLLQKNAVFEMIFTEPGIYYYQGRADSRPDKMAGLIIVQE